MLQAPAIDVFVPSFLLRLRSYASPLLSASLFLHRSVAPPFRVASVIGIYLYICFYPCFSLFFSLFFYLSPSFSQPRQITAAAVAVCLSTLIVTYTRRCKALYDPLTVHSRPRSRLKGKESTCDISNEVTIEIYYAISERMEFCRIYFSRNDLRNEVFVISM